MATDPITKEIARPHVRSAARFTPTVLPWRTDVPQENRSRRQAIAIVDLGGQYCHLIARRLRDIGVWPQIYPSSVDRAELASYAGVILSGGPQSVYDNNSPSVDSLLSLPGPVLGVCYGHQLIAFELGADVRPGNEEYGLSRLSVGQPGPLFEGTDTRQTVWMSHSDAVFSVPETATVLARTDRCEVAAFADYGRKYFGVQFHPEVTHTEFGKRILENFALGICGLQREKDTTQRIDHLIEQIRFQVGKRSVFFLVSGGVDSTVAFTLCARALPPRQLLGVYVDTGLMRKGETDELRASLEHFGVGTRLKIRDESRRFLTALKGCIDPEAKRKIIGRLFLDVQSEAMQEYGIDGDHWLLGQGTIYPDTIESGGHTGSAALIKTHHNRCAEVRELLDAGLVIEPLAEFYKDEVRQIGEALGLSPTITKRWPFPGPGLAIRCLCTASEDAEGRTPASIDLSGEFSGYKATSIPLRSVGVQGDGRTYRDVVAISGALDYAALQKISSHLCNVGKVHNRVILQLSGSEDTSRYHILRGKTLTEDRLQVLREADFIVREEMTSRGLTNVVWQFPVVLIPLSEKGGESVVLRPVNSEDGMTANFGRLSGDVLTRMADRIRSISGVDAVFLDISDKPPATIEWE